MTGPGVRTYALLLLALAASACARTAPPTAAQARASESPPVVEQAAVSVDKAVVKTVTAEPAPRLPVRTVADKTQAISFDDIKLDLKKDEPYKQEKLTLRVKQLTGQSVRIRGWILPTSVYTQRGIKQFVLVRDNQQCCFGPGAALHDCVVVDLDEGQTTSFSNRPIAVEGVFTLNEVLDPDGQRTLAIYHLQANSAGE